MMAKREEQAERAVAIKNEIKRKVHEVKPVTIETKPKVQPSKKIDEDNYRNSEETKKQQKKSDLEEKRRHMREEMRKKKKEHVQGNSFDVQIFTAAGKATVDTDKESDGMDNTPSEHQSAHSEQTSNHKPYVEVFTHKHASSTSNLHSYPVKSKSRAVFNLDDKEEPELAKAKSAKPDIKALKKQAKDDAGLFGAKQFLDKDYSEEGIEIFVKGAPPPPKKLIPMIPSPQLADFSKKEGGQNLVGDVLGSPNSKPRTLEYVSPKKIQKGFEGMVLTPISESQGNFGSASPGKKVLKLSPSEEEIIAKIAEKDSKDKGKERMSSDVQRLYQSDIGVVSGGTTPNSLQEETFDKDLENVSKLDSKKNMQEQINSSYAILEMRRVELERQIGERRFVSVYNAVRDRVGSSDPR